jgi:hypothetical protein
MTTLLHLSLLFRPVQAQFIHPLLITITEHVIDDLARRAVEGRP